MKDYCTCANYECKMHPRNHELGCTPCIRANLKTKDIPTCFFNLVDGAESRPGDTFADFAAVVLKEKSSKSKKLDI